MRLVDKAIGLVLKEALKWPAAVKFMNENETVHTLLNRLAINKAVGSTAARPQPYSLWTPRAIGEPIPPHQTYPDGTPKPDDPVDYITWAGLYDRRFTGRHLPPAPQSYMDRLASAPLVDPVTKQPGPKTVLGLYTRNQFIPSKNCSALLPFFAQWFTDSFLRKDPTDERLNTSNHEIDLCQIYGLDAPTARALRTGQGGKLKTRSDGKFPELLYHENLEVKQEFQRLSYVQKLPDGLTLEDRVLGSLNPQPPNQSFLDERKRRLYATGLERGNSTIFYTAISTIFIREHNRLCDELAKAYPAWKNDDNRLFEIARNINIVMLLYLTINEYINQLAQPPVKLRLDREFAEKEHWYRANRIAIEFDLLYRWHSFVPDQLRLPDKILGTDDHREYRFNNALMEQYGAATLIAAASRQPAGQIGLHNNPEFLWQAELVAHTFSRSQRVRPFNEYRVFFGQKPVNDFKELTGDDRLADELAQLYRDVNDVEFLVGLFAQKHTGPAVLPSLLNAMVGVDAFSQILTNPLLSQNVYGPDAFSNYGMDVIKNTTSFHVLVERNKMGEAYPNPASFAYSPPTGAEVPPAGAVH
jgi:prostaglandin-endoperoxide synthase 2